MERMFDLLLGKPKSCGNRYSPLKRHTQKISLFWNPGQEQQIEWSLDQTHLLIPREPSGEAGGNWSSPWGPRHCQLPFGGSSFYHGHCCWQKTFWNPPSLLAPGSHLAHTTSADAPGQANSAAGWAIPTTSLAALRSPEPTDTLKTWPCSQGPGCSLHQHAGTSPDPRSLKPNTLGHSSAHGCEHQSQDHCHSTSCLVRTQLTHQQASSRPQPPLGDAVWRKLKH